MKVKTKTRAVAGLFALASPLNIFKVLNFKNVKPTPAQTNATIPTAQWKTDISDRKINPISNNYQVKITSLKSKNLNQATYTSHFSLPTLLFLFSVSLLSCKNKNTEGEKLYQAHCISCHQEGGKGVGKLIPPIDKTYLLENSSKLGCIIKYGLQDSIQVQNINYQGSMPANKKITDFDIVNILNYINQNFGSGETKKFNIEQLRKDLKNCI